MSKALSVRGVEGRRAELVINDFIEAELEGKSTHGIGKFLSIGQSISERMGNPRVLREGPGYLLVDGNRELGVVSASYCIDRLIEKVRSQGVAMAGMINYGRYGRLTPFGRAIAQAGMAGIVMNNAGPPAVAPFDGIDPILGTNPICFAFPSMHGPRVFDFSTAKFPWGAVRQAVLSKGLLPPGAFLDSNGKVTRDPEKATAVMPFGGPKGFALCLAIEILGGALVGGKVGTQVDSQYDLGFLALAMSPESFGSGPEFAHDTESLFGEIKSSRCRGRQRVRLPSEKSEALKQKSLAAGVINIDESILNRLKSMADNPQDKGFGTFRNFD